ncbi:hypothetical protein ACGFNU_30425 [Spirillospora sp. NPDC048911]|uniref:hypothetical protein n=1 Tax=Spirillospora sp. NPDC048911 TaxID=3364527 RepID=UPI00371F40B5
MRIDGVSVTAHLEALERIMDERGFKAGVIHATTDYSYVRIVNEQVAQLAEDISCSMWDGELFYMWSWSGPICPVRHIESAADRIAFVLTPERATG